MSKLHKKKWGHVHKNKAGYMAQDSPSTRLREGILDLQTDTHTYIMVSIHTRGVAENTIGN